jgi:hypothetical protein
VRANAALSRGSKNIDYELCGKTNSLMLRTNKNPLVLAIAVAIPTLAAVVAWFVTENTRLIWQNTGGELPPFTQIWLSCYRWWWVCALMVLIGGWFWPVARQRNGLALSLGAVFGATILLITFLGVYQMIFSLGAVVS